MLAILLLATSSQAAEIRSSIASDSNTWNANDFAGFYYDMNNDIGTESLSTIITDGNRLSGNAPCGVAYTTTAQAKEFDFDGWGSYRVIGFLGQRYFAGYNSGYEGSNGDSAILYQKSADENSLADEQLESILLDDDRMMTFTSGTPIKLEEGYELNIGNIDPEGLHLELTKDGSVVDSRTISPSIEYATMADKTYYYARDVGAQSGLVTIAVHFKNALLIEEQSIATVDGIWQISDEPLDVRTGTRYEKMRIASVDASSGTITMDNKDNEITLDRNANVLLMPGISIRTADDEALRYCICKEVTEPGPYELRSTIATESYTWTADNFAGFYYDFDEDIKTEELTTTITDLKLFEPDGIRYITTSQSANFEFEDWGSYRAIGFLGQKFFAGYDYGYDGTGGILFQGSIDENSLADEQLQMILIDSDEDRTLTHDAPLSLAEGYELHAKYMDENGIYLELKKDGMVVDTRVMTPFRDGANMADRTYRYSVDMGEQKGLVIIAAHFKSPVRIDDRMAMIVDGVWQLSETPQELEVGTQFDRMTIEMVDASSGVIAMDNRDSTITLSKNKEISLMQGISIRTADNDTLRYCIFTEATS